jgi:acyl transferase domain-containing protein
VVLAADGSAEAALLDQTVFTQTALFAFEVALYRLVEHWGLRPDYLVGHSIGELAAAHVSGVLALDDACALVAARGRLMQTQRGDGAMVALEASEAEVLPVVAGHRGQIDVAAVNGPHATVVSGDADVVDQIAETFRRRGRGTRRLRVSHAFHSPHTDPILAEFRRVAQGLAYAPATIPVVANLTGRLATADQLRTPDYWVDQLRGTVRHGDAMRTMHELGVAHYLELGPHADLTDPTALARLHVQGVDVDWENFFGGRGARRVELPTYAFDRQHHWITAPPPQPRTGIHLADLTGATQERALLDLIRTHVADVLGHVGAESIAEDDRFLEIGLSSFTTLDVRNRLCEVVGLVLPPAVLYDYPTPAELARYLCAELAGERR